MNFFPMSASTFSHQVDSITFALLVLCGGMALFVFGLILVFVIRYRKSVHPVPEKTQPKISLEVAWTIVPLAIFMGIFSWGAKAYFRMHLPPNQAMAVYVVGKQWMWKFQHDDGRQELEELHVPVGIPIRLVMSSEDVIHSLYIPAFRIKQDVLPGRTSETWFEATHPGEYPLFCTQYCGTSHSGMRARVVAMNPADFSKWRENRKEAQ